ncbi:MAG: hypothetical protein ABIP30_00925 [Ferruginibacter sp.]
MKQLFFISISIILLGACSTKNTTPAQPISESPVVEVVTNFFPVTTFIKGQILDIKKGGTNPVNIITENQKTDSSWLKMDDLDDQFSDFLTPLIDTANLSTLFSEKKFLDQSLNAYTFTYDAKATLPDSFNLLRWDVYIKPDDNKVKRIYMIKKAGVGIENQLTWEADNWAKIVTLKTAADGNTSIVKEQMIKWKF